MQTVGIFFHQLSAQEACRAFFLYFNLSCTKTILSVAIHAYRLSYQKHVGLTADSSYIELFIPPGDRSFFLKQSMLTRPTWQDNHVLVNKQFHCTLTTGT